MTDTDQSAKVGVKGAADFCKATREYGTSTNDVTRAWRRFQKGPLPKDMFYKEIGPYGTFGRARTRFFTWDRETSRLVQKAQQWGAI